MDQIDAQSHESQSFVIRLWLEDAAGADTSSWRGHVTHVESRDRCSVDSLTGIAWLLATRLVTAGFRLRWYERIWMLLMNVRRR